jgi:exoribonuclease-2
MTRAHVKVSDVDLLQLSAAVRVLEIESAQSSSQASENQEASPSGETEEDANLD